MNLRQTLIIIAALTICSALFNLFGIESFSGDHHELNTFGLSSRKKKLVSPGFIILGMHRSGTSLLAGLLHTGFGYNIGDNLLNTNEQNPRGFFERKDVARQNDAWLQSQGMSWYDDVKLMSFGWEEALSFQNPWKKIKSGTFVLKKEKNKTTHRKLQGIRTLEFLLNCDNMPWLLKEPRLCITLLGWLKMLQQSLSETQCSKLHGGNTEFSLPPVIFTYRHPLEVAASLEHRNDLSFEKGLKLWLIYNRKAIENSSHLCRIYTSNIELLNNPMQEVQRISKELSQRCGVPPPPKEIELSDVKEFINADFQHTSFVHSDSDPKTCFEAEYKNAKEEHKKLNYFTESIQVFCDLRSGLAYEENYKWPKIRYYP